MLSEREIRRKAAFAEFEDICSGAVLTFRVIPARPTGARGDRSRRRGRERCKWSPLRAADGRILAACNRACVRGAGLLLLRR